MNYTYVKVYVRVYVQKKEDTTAAAAESYVRIRGGV